MNRRGFASSIILAGAIGISGCLGGGQEGDDIQDSDGDGVIDSEDYAPQDPNVQEKSDLNNDDSKSSNHEETEDNPTTTRGETPSDTPTGTPTEAPTDSTSDASADRAIQAYEAGYDDKTRAHRELEDGEGQWRDDLYLAAAEAYDRSGTYFQESTEHLRTAERVAGELGSAGAKEIAKQAVRHTSLFAKTAQKAEEWAKAIHNHGKDSPQANQAEREYHAVVDDFKREDIPARRNFQKALDNE